MRQVIYAWNYLEWGGAQIHILALIKRVRLDHEVTVVLPAGSDPQFLSFLDELGITYKFFEGHLDSAPADSVIRKLSRHLQKIRSEGAMLRALAEFDLRNAVVHTDLSPQQSMLALEWLARRTQVFVTSHNALPPVSAWRTRLWKWKLGRLARLEGFNVFCSNEDSKRYFSQFYPADFAAKIPVTYTSINPEEIDQALATGSSQSETRAKFSIPEEKFVVLGVGQFIDRKGRWTFLEAARNAIAKEPDISFVWLTPKMPDAAALEKIATYGLGESFRLVLSEQVGKERSDVLGFFRIADVFALPSFVEGLPIALLEAMALGIPSISTNVYAIPEAVIDMETGILIGAGDSESLAIAILRLRQDPELRKRLSAKGRAHVIEHFDERDAAELALRTYKERFGNG
jgi:glycosyltransferase involved in cell wall biosynthesis